MDAHKEEPAEERLVFFIYVRSIGDRHFVFTPCCVAAGVNVTRFVGATEGQAATVLVEFRNFAGV